MLEASPLVTSLVVEYARVQWCRDLQKRWPKRWKVQQPSLQHHMITAKRGHGLLEEGTASENHLAAMFTTWHPSSCRRETRTGGRGCAQGYRRGR